MNSMTGTIKTLKNHYGFIAVDGQDRDVFFHETDLRGVKFEDLYEGEEAEFEIVKTDKGFKAKNIVIK